MCLLPNTHIIDGIPYTDNIVYPPFIQAAKFGEYHPGNSISGSVGGDKDTQSCAGDEDSVDDADKDDTLILLTIPTTMTPTQALWALGRSLTRLVTVLACCVAFHDIFTARP